MAIFDTSIESLLQQYAKPILMQNEQAQQSPQAKPEKQTLMNSPAFSQALLNLSAGVAQNQANGGGVGQGLAFGARSFGQTLQNARKEQEERERQATRERLEAIKGLIGLKVDQEGLNIRKDQLGLEERRVGVTEQNAELQRRNINSQISGREGDRIAQQQAEAKRRNYLIMQGVDPDLAGAFPNVAADSLFNRPTPTPHTDLAKLTADYKNGLITEEAYKSQSQAMVDGAPEDAFADENTLRDEYNNLSKDFFQIEGAYNRIKGAAVDPTAAGDISLLINFMKLNDPGSTVREGEFATAQNAGGVPDRTRALYNSIVSGQRLSEAQRSDFVGQAGKLFKSAKDTQKPVIERYKGLAKRNKLNPENVVTEIADIIDTPLDLDAQIKALEEELMQK